MIKKYFKFKNVDRNIIFFLGTAILILVTLMILDNYFLVSYQDILIEAHGLLFDLIIFGLILAVYDSRTKKKTRINRLLEELDDYRHWDEKESVFRKTGIIRRLNQLKYYKLNLVGNYLQNARLSNLNLAESDFSWANLEASYFNHSNLRDTKFNMAKLNRAFMRVTELNGAVFNSASLVNANLGKSDLYGAQFIDADLSETDIDECCCSSTNFLRSNLTKADMNNTDLTMSIMSGVNLEYANLSNTNLSGVDLSSCNLVGLNLSGAMVDSVNFIHKLKKAKGGGEINKYFTVDPNEYKTRGLSYFKIVGNNPKSGRYGDAELLEVD